MGRQIKGLLYFFGADIRRSILIFWAILLSILIICLIGSVLLSDVDGGFMMMTLTIPIYIYCAIAGFITVKEAIPFSIKMGATRKSLFLSLGILFLSLSIVQSVLASTIQTAVNAINPLLGIENFAFFHVVYFMQDTWFTRIMVDLSITFFCFTLFFVIGLLFYKYGLAGGGTVIGLLVILLLFGFAQGWLVDFIIQTFQGLHLTVFYQLFLIGIVLYALSILLLRKITIVKAY